MWATVYHAQGLDQFMLRFSCRLNSWLTECNSMLMKIKRSARPPLTIQRPFVSVWCSQLTHPICLSSMIQITLTEIDNLDIWKSKWKELGRLKIISHFKYVLESIMPLVYICFLYLFLTLFHFPPLSISLLLFRFPVIVCAFYNTPCWNGMTVDWYYNNTMQWWGVVCLFSDSWFVSSVSHCQYCLSIHKLVTSVTSLGHPVTNAQVTINEWSMWLSVDLWLRGTTSELICTRWYSHSFFEYTVIILTI